MDQPGSRHLAEKTPLIIERPELAHPLRRVSALCLTTVAWAFWLFLWLPVLAMIASHFGWHLPSLPQTSRGSLGALQLLVQVFPLAIGTVFALLAFNGLINWVYRRFKKTAAHAEISDRQLANAMALDAAKLAEWQSARIVSVSHNDQGMVIDAKIVKAG